VWPRIYALGLGDRALRGHWQGRSLSKVADPPIGANAATAMPVPQSHRFCRRCGNFAILTAIRRASAGTTLFGTERISCSASFLTLPINSGRNNAPDKLFLDRVRATTCVGEPHETITHRGFNRGADDCCRSVAHKFFPTRRRLSREDNAGLRTGIA